MRVNSTPFLGIQIDENLQWKDHILNVSKKISKIAGILYKLRSVLPQRILVLLYNTLVLPHLSYCNVVWGNTYPTRLDCLFKIQKKIIRIITFSAHRTPSKPLFLSLKILNIYKLNEYLMSILIFKTQKKVVPQFITNMLILNNEVHSYNTRSSNKYHVRNVTKDYVMYSFRYTGPCVWNSIPIEISLANTQSLFKRKLKLFLLANDK